MMFSEKSERERERERESASVTSINVFINYISPVFPLFHKSYFGGGDLTLCLIFGRKQAGVENQIIRPAVPYCTCSVVPLFH
jgi:hypothetical protein